MHLFSGWMPDSPVAHLAGDEPVVVPIRSFQLFINFINATLIY